MFDPERDVDHTTRRFYLRILAVLVISVVGCLALYPSVTSFPVGAEKKGCLAVADGWHADHAAPSAADRVVESAAGPFTRPSPEDEVIVERVEAYDEWRIDAGACIPESRHRLILSAVGLAPLFVGFAVAGIVRRAHKQTRKSLHPDAAEVAEPERRLVLKS